MQEKNNCSIQIPHKISSLAFLCVIILVWFLELNGQNPQDSVVSEQFNADLLASLLKGRIDSVRVRMGGCPLKFDTILEKAALDQSSFLENQQNISHTQPSPDKSSVKKRIQYYGGAACMCGENVAASFLSVKMIDKTMKAYYNSTYIELADEFLKLWMQSDQHYKNFLNGDYNATGIGVSLNSTTKRIVAV